MGIYRKIETILLRICEWFWITFITIHEYKNIFKKRHLIKKVSLTDEQKHQIDEFYLKNYGKKIPYWWHRLYQSYTGKFDYKYFPEILYSTKLEPRFNKRIESLPFENKNMLEVLFGNNPNVNVKIPKTYLMRVNGAFFDKDRKPISYESAIDYIKSLEGFKGVAKVSIDTSSGRGVEMIEIFDGVDRISKRKVEDLLLNKGMNYVIQEKIVPHVAFQRLYPSAINTLRVITYRLEEQICIAPIAMRIGQGDSVVDNLHAGGITIGVSKNGVLKETAFTEYGKKYERHPDTNVLFEGYTIPKVPEICETAKQLHSFIPMFKFVSWDFTVDSEENIVLIEANLHSQGIWISQYVNGVGFLENNTEAILAELKKI